MVPPGDQDPVPADVENIAVPAPEGAPAGAEREGVDPSLDPVQVPGPDYDPVPADVQNFGVPAPEGAPAGAVREGVDLPLDPVQLPGPVSPAAANPVLVGSPYSVVSHDSDATVPLPGVVLGSPFSVVSHDSDATVPLPFPLPPPHVLRRDPVPDAVESAHH